MEDYKEEDKCSSLPRDLSAGERKKASLYLGVLKLFCSENSNSRSEIDIIVDRDKEGLNPLKIIIFSFKIYIFQ